MRGVIVTLLVPLVCVACPKEQAEAPKMGKYSPGQVWIYKTRPGEEASRVTVLKVENEGKNPPVIHIRVDGVAIKSPTAKDGVSPHIAHMPFALEALDASLVKLESSGAQLPDFSEGYNIWKESADQGKAGVFTITVAESVDFMETALNPTNAAAAVEGHNPLGGAN